jgi:hypothetical protein
MLTANVVSSTLKHQCLDQVHHIVVGPYLLHDLPPQWPGFDPRPGYVGFVVDKVALGQVPPANSSSTDCSTVIIIYHPGLVQ